MASSSTQFASVQKMGFYDPLHQISMWEEAFKANISTKTATAGASLLRVVETSTAAGLENQSEYASTESLEPSGSNQAAKHALDKIQRRLAQNREAARKSRLRKKVYVKQLETCRLKLAQVEQELERTRHQRLAVGGFMGTDIFGYPGSVNSGIVAFEMEYGNWVEEQQKMNCDLRNVLQDEAAAVDTELNLLVQNVLKHYYNLFRMKTDLAKIDVFYLMFGAWRTPIERLYMWIGGFRPSEVLNILLPRFEPLSEEQNTLVQNLQLSCQQAEVALSQGMDKLHHILTQGVESDIIMNVKVHNNAKMVLELEKLNVLESFVNQADHLRQQTLEQMSRILTTKQAAQGLLALGEYFERLRALSSLWSAARPS